MSYRSYGKRPARQYSSYSSKRRKTISAPVARRTIERAVRPTQIAGTPFGQGIIVSKKQYVKDISGSVNFSTGSGKISINPGLAGTFPWLARLAAMYQKYVMVELKVRYKSMAPTDATGSVMLAFDYEPDDALPTDKQAMLSKIGCVSSAPWEDKTLYCSPRLFQNNAAKYIRAQTGSIVGNLDNYDGAFLIVATSGQADTSPIGELHMEYTFQLLDPHIPDEPKDMTYSLARESWVHWSGADTLTNALRGVSGTLNRNCVWYNGTDIKLRSGEGFFRDADITTTGYEDFQSGDTAHPAAVIGSVTYGGNDLLMIDFSGNMEKGLFRLSIYFDFTAGAGKTPATTTGALPALTNSLTSANPSIKKIISDSLGGTQPVGINNAVSTDGGNYLISYIFKMDGSITPPEGFKGHGRMFLLDFSEYTTGGVELNLTEFQINVQQIAYDPNNDWQTFTKSYNLNDNLYP